MGFPVNTEAGTVNVVDKLPTGELVAEDGSILKPTTKPLVSEVVEAKEAVLEAIEEVKDVVEEVIDLIDGEDDEDVAPEAEDPEAAEAE